MTNHNSWTNKIEPAKRKISAHLFSSQSIFASFPISSICIRTKILSKCNKKRYRFPPILRRCFSPPPFPSITFFCAKKHFRPAVYIQVVHPISRFFSSIVGTPLYAPASEHLSLSSIIKPIYRIPPRSCPIRIPSQLFSLSCSASILGAHMCISSSSRENISIISHSSLPGHI